MQATKKQKMKVHVLDQPCIVVLSDGETWADDCEFLFLQEADLENIVDGKSIDSVPDHRVHRVSMKQLIEAYREYEYNHNLPPGMIRTYGGYGH